jgi:hypothetical protein
MWEVQCGRFYVGRGTVSRPPLLASFERWDSDDIETVELLNTATVKLFTSQYLEAVCARLNAPT